MNVDTGRQVTVERAAQVGSNVQTIHEDGLDTGGYTTVSAGNPTLTVRQRL